MAELPYRQTPDPVVQQTVEPLRRRLNELERQASGIQDAARAAGVGMLRFEMVKGPSSGLQEHDIELFEGQTTKLTHNLGKRLTGFVVVDHRSGSLTSAHYVTRITNDGTTDADDRKDLWLTQAGPGSTGQVITVRIMVF